MKWKLTLKAVALFAAAYATPMPQAAAQSSDARSGKCKSTDLVIAIDDTYSMNGAIREMKNEAQRLVNLVDIVSEGDFQMGLVSFKDDIEIDLDLNAAPNPMAKKQAMHDAIDRLHAEEGAGGPEASDEALLTILNSLPSEGRSQSGDFTGQFSAHTRIIVLITDNLPGGFDDLFIPGEDDQRAQEVADAAKTANVRISTIYIPTNYLGPDPQIMEVMRMYASTTGGLFAMTHESGRGTAEAIATIIETCGLRPFV